MKAMESDVRLCMQDLLTELTGLRARDDIIAIYLLRSDESGKVVYYSYKQKKNISMRTVKVLIVTNSSVTLDILGEDWYPLLVQDYYQNVNYPRSAIDLAREKSISESFLVFDKREAEDTATLTSYVNNSHVGALLTDFPRFDWDYKNEFVAESLVGCLSGDDIAYYVSLVLEWCEEYFLHLPNWVVQVNCSSTALNEVVS